MGQAGGVTGQRGEWTDLLPRGTSSERKGPPRLPAGAPASGVAVGWRQGSVDGSVQRSLLETESRLEGA